MDESDDPFVDNQSLTSRFNRLSIASARESSLEHLRQQMSTKFPQAKEVCKDHAERLYLAKVVAGSLARLLELAMEMHQQLTFEELLGGGDVRLSSEFVDRVEYLKEQLAKYERVSLVVSVSCWNADTKVP